MLLMPSASSLAPRVAHSARRQHRNVQKRQLVTATAQTDPGLQLPIEKELQQVLLSSPLDFFAFGPRVALAAALSVDETSQIIQKQVTRLQELAGDPRPIEVKALEFNQEVQVTLADYAKRGRTLEEDILRNVAVMLPDEVRPFVPTPPPPAPVQTTTVVIEEEEEEFDYSTFSASAMMEQQAASELAELKRAVESLQSALTSMSENKDAGKDAMLRLNAREARDTLKRRLEQLSPTLLTTYKSTSAESAVKEATDLIIEVEPLLQ